MHQMRSLVVVVEPVSNKLGDKFRLRFDNFHGLS